MTRVLAVDDDPIILQLLKATLVRAGFDVFIASSGVKAVEAARQLNPDVVVLDLMMPAMDGWEVCQTIRTFSQVPILILSAVIDSPRVMRALDAGANDYLIKPAPEGVLIARVKKLAG